jgi:anti-sigma factor RsiW
MEFDETVLRAFVDGELSSSERSRVEAALAQSETLQASVAALRASCLPYRAAFDGEASPPVPAGLAERLAMFSAVASSSNPPMINSAPTALTSANQPRRASLRWAGIGGALAASFVAGIGTRSIWPSVMGPSSTAGQGATKAAEWVEAVANYQAMYVRDTVDRPADNKDRAVSVIAEFQVKTQATLVVPDLTSAGFAFKRVQRLSFNNKPLLQIAYLPTVGLTGAICMMQSETSGDVALQAHQLHRLSLVTWQRQGLSYVFVADAEIATVKAIGEKLVASQFPILYKV